MLSLKSALTQLANWINGVNDYVIEQSLGENGYTKWNSGKLEQWGHSYIPAQLGNGSTTINFTIPFVDTRYKVLITGTDNFTGYCLAENYYTSANRVCTTTSTVVSVVKRDVNEKYNVWFSWYAIGQWK